MNVNCGTSSCPLILNSICVFYEGIALPYIGINTNDSVQVALQKIEEAFSETGSGVVVALVAGTGISIGGTSQIPIVTNILPDQTVTFVSGTGISVTGTYPNFTITNTSPGGTNFWPLSGAATLTSNVTIDADNNDVSIINVNTFNVTNVNGPSLTVSDSAVAITGTASEQINVSSGIAAMSSGSSSILVSTSSIDFRTSAVSRLLIESDGSWNIGGSNGTAGQVLTSNGSATAPTWQAATSGGITNTAVINELMKSNGTNAVSSGLFSTVAGNITLGTGLAGSTRTITADGSAATVELTLSPKGTSGAVNTTSLLNVVGISTSSIRNDNSATNSIIYALTLSGTSTGTPVVGIGTGLKFLTETGVSNFEEGVLIEAVTTDVTATSEDFDIVFKTMSGGATASERMRYITTAARFSVTGDVFASGALQAVSGINATNGTISSTLDDGVTSQVSYLLNLTHTTTGTPANGIGTGIRLHTETSAGNTEVGAIIEAVTTDVTLGSEYFDLIFKTMSAGAAAVERFRITSDGRLYGTALHNNAGSVTGTTNQYITSGTYTPTVTQITNLDSNTPSQCQWIRIGNVVIVSGEILVNASVGDTVTEWRISLPIASNFTISGNCGGASGNKTTTSVANNTTAAIFADTTNDEARFFWTSGSTVDVTITFEFMYVIL